jgi:NAD(P)-dependent dehydrogenase (short-subunit alcohol dehydrogenase family)
VINNAGIGTSTLLLDGDFESAREAMEVNYFGTWAVSRAFAPVLARNGGGAVVNMLSVASWVNSMPIPGYPASKAAQWSLTDALRRGLAGQGTQVVGVHCGWVETDLSTPFDVPKIPASEVAEGAMRRLLAGETEVLVDEWTREVKAALSAAPVAA